MRPNSKANQNALSKSAITPRCYLCGAQNPTTRDHIPPKGFFPEPRPSNLITHPCCDSCNKSYCLDDDAARVWLSAALGHSQAAEWIIQNKVLPGTLTHSPAFRSVFRASMENIVITNEEGKQIDAVTFPIDRERIERFTIRIAKGLLKHYYPDYDSEGHSWQSEYVEPRLDLLAKIQPLRDGLPHYDFRGDGVIQYRFGFTKEGLTGIWLLIFYEAVIFIVTHRKSEPTTEP